MYKAVIFGGTVEGRKLCEYCEAHGVKILYCVATEEGAQTVISMKNIKAHVKRLNAGEMAELLERENPEIVVDATHPYAKEATRNIKEACGNRNIKLIRVEREILEQKEQENCFYFEDIDSLTSWLEKTPGVIFSTLGVSAARAFARLTDYQNRVWLRILPSMESLRVCLDLDYRTNRLICIQGPFSEELNHAMFKSTNAGILVTKDSGAAGGFGEKIRAAQNLGMKVAVLSNLGTV